MQVCGTDYRKRDVEPDRALWFGLIVPVLRSGFVFYTGIEQESRVMAPDSAQYCGGFVLQVFFFCSLRAPDCARFCGGSVLQECGTDYRKRNVEPDRALWYGLNVPVFRSVLFCIQAGGKKAGIWRRPRAVSSISA